MNWKHSYLVAVLSVFGLATLATVVTADPAKSTNIGTEAKPEQQLPPGWTEADLQAYAEASTPGKMQEFLAREEGEWVGKSTMWMGPGGEGIASDTSAKVTVLMDGRYTRCEVQGEIPGMGPFNGLGIYGYDNVAKKFVATWLDNHSTGLMNGEGTLSKDEKTLTWKYTFHCPITKKPTIMRQVETFTSPTTKTMVMYGPDPKTGKEYKMMSIEMTRK